MKRQAVARSGVAAVAAAVTFAFSPVAALHGQQTRSLTYTETTRVEMPGALGMFLRLAGGSGTTTTRTGIHLQGRVYIHETDRSAFVFDLDEGRMLSIDHENRTYQSLSLEEMARLSEEALAQARAEATGADPQAQQQVEETRAEIDFRISSDATGRRERIGGYNAEQYILEAEFTAREVPDGVEQPEGGTMFFVAELWQTDDVPGEAEIGEAWARMLAADPQFREMAQEVAEFYGVSGQNLAASLAAWDPQMGAGLAEMTQEMGEISGTTLRTIVAAAIAPPGMDVDRDELLAWQPSAGNTLGNVARAAARESIANAARGALGGLLGGRGRAPEPEPEPEPAAENRPVPLFRITTTRDNLSYRESNDDVYGALKQRIAGYSVQTFDDLMRELQQQ